MFFLKRHRKYVWSELGLNFIGTTLFFYVTFLMLQLFRLADFLIVHQVPLPVVVQIAGYLLLSFSHFVFPISFLMAVLMTFGRLSGDQEYVSMRASGISHHQMMSSVLVIALIVSGLTFLVCFEWAPWGERQMTRALYTVGASKITSGLQAGAFNSDFFDLLLYAESIDPKSSRMKHVFLFDEREKGNPVTVIADEGEITPVVPEEIDETKYSSSLSHQAVLKLYQGAIHRKSPEPDMEDQIKFSEYQLYLRVDAEEVSAPDLPRMADLKDLRGRLLKWDPKSKAYLDFSTEYWKRIMLSILPLGFALLGMGLGVGKARNVTSKGMLVTLLTAFIYWMLLVWCVSYATQGRLIPWVAMLVPNFFVFVVGVVAYKRLKY